MTAGFIIIARRPEACVINGPVSRRDFKSSLALGETGCKTCDGLGAEKNRLYRS